MSSIKDLVSGNRTAWHQWDRQVSEMGPEQLSRGDHGHAVADNLKKVPLDVALTVPFVSFALRMRECAMLKADAKDYWKQAGMGALDMVGGSLLKDVADVAFHAGMWAVGERDE